MTANRSPFGTRAGARRAGADQKLRIRRAAQADRREPALALVAKQRERLERQIARQQEEPAIGPAIGAAFKDVTSVALGTASAVETVPPKVSPPRHRHRFEPYEGEPVPGWTVARAWGLLEQGYTVMHAMHRSGCGWMHFEHLRIGEDGRLLPE